MFLVLAFLAALFQNASTAKVPICKSIDYTLKTTATPGGPLLYTYNFNMDVKVSKKYPEFPNKITISNFTEFSFDDSLYFRASPPIFTIDNNFQFNCTSSTINGPWIIYVPDGEISSSIEYYHQKLSFGNITDQVGMYLSDGTFYQNGGYLMDPLSNPCLTSDGSLNGVNYSYFACCKQFDYVEIPDTLDDPCLEYETNGTISYSFEEVNVRFAVHYVITFDGQLRMEINMLQVPKVSYQYFLKFNEQKICEGSAAISARTCTYKLPFFNDDFEMDLRFAFYTTNGVPIMIPIGELKKRNGIWLKAGNVLFTPKEPCSTHASTLPFIYATSESSFCSATAAIIFGVHKYYLRRPGPQYSSMGLDL
uniref:Uncharacterized protein n=1 Tax=Panagrolaimus sp. ES5 TaxID=591445 RepID=A0AC34GNA5_9BILA